MIPAIVGYCMMLSSPENADLLNLEQERDTLAQHDTWTSIPMNERPYASTFIMSNNIRMAILAFGGGIALGLFSVYLLIFNGLVIGGGGGAAAPYDTRPERPGVAAR